MAGATCSMVLPHQSLDACPDIQSRAEPAQALQRMRRPGSLAPAKTMSTEYSEAVTPCLHRPPPEID